jgi:NAD(P)-dependent dehydrogenase (short-subunit alcohol dehydrogenase family)
MDLELRDKVAQVAREGAKVIVNGRTAEAVDAAVSALQSSSGGTVMGFAGDLSDAAEAEALVRRHPGVDILAAAAGEGSSSFRARAAIRYRRKWSTTG